MLFLTETELTDSIICQVVSCSTFPLPGTTKEKKKREVKRMSYMKGWAKQSIGERTSDCFLNWKHQ